MSKAGTQLIAGMQEAAAVARGEASAHSITMEGRTYVPIEEYKVMKLRAVTAEQRLPMSERDWQPIETAPKDEGTDILVARFDEDGSNWYAVAQWWVAAFAFMYQNSRQSMSPILLCFEPTHWQPLPPPPSPIKEE